MFNKSIQRGFFLLIGASMVLPTSAVYAQSSLEEIVVTARKRSESLQDVPASVSAFSADTIEQAGISNARDYVTMLPNVTMTETQNTGFAFINMRGLSQLRNTDPTVAVVVDGVLQTTSLGFNQDLHDIAQIEVLKGPQGALYGRNAVGGAINVTTRQPSNEFEGKILGGFGNAGSVMGSVSLSGPLVEDKLLGRLIVAHRDSDGTRGSVNSDVNADAIEDTTIRGKLAWNVSDNLIVDLRYSHIETDAPGSNFRAAAPAFNNFVGPNGEFNFPPRVCSLCTNINEVVPLDTLPIFVQNAIGNSNEVLPLQANQSGIDERTVDAFSVKIDWDVSFGTITSVTSWDKLDQVTGGDQFPFFPVNPVGGLNAVFAQNRFHEGVSEEFKITSNDDQRLRWIAGVYWAKTELDTMIAINRDLEEGTDWIRGTAPNLSGTNPTATWTERFLAATGGNVAANPNLNPTALSYNFDTLESDAFAVYAQFNYDVTDNVELSFSLRYDRDERSLTVNTPQEFLPVFAFPSATEGEVRSQDFDAVQPKLTLRWKPSDDTTIYGTYAEGFRSGAFNLSGVTAGIDSLAAAGVPGTPNGVRDFFDQEDSSSFELGVKHTALDGRLNLSGAVFRTELDDAFTFTFLAAFTSQITRNIAESEITGIEGTATWLVNDNLQLDLGFGYMDTEIKASDWIGAFGVDLVGNKLPYNPEYSYNVGATYEWQLNDATDAFARLDYSYQGEMFFGVENFSPRDELELINFRTGVRIEGGWEVSAWAKNLTDENYVSDTTNPSGAEFYGLQRRYGLEVSKSF